MLEWFNRLSYGGSLLVQIYAIFRAPMIEDDQKPASPSITNENHCQDSKFDDNQQSFEPGQLTIQIYQLSHQLDELLSHQQYKDARLVFEQLDAALNRFITVKQTEFVNKP